MKKAFNLKFLALSGMLMLGNVVANAARPANGPLDGTAVGATIKIGDQIGLVTYRVTGWEDAANKQFYNVKITGFDADGLDALAAARAAGSKVTLRIPVTFEEKFGEEKYKYAVTLIEDGLNGTTKQSFYGLTEVDTLIFVDGTNYNGVALDKFTYTVGTNGGPGKSFYGCTNMKKLEFTENCTYIGKYAFQNTGIREFVIPKKCATVEEFAFYNCKYLKTVSVASGNTAMHTLGNYVFGNSALQTLDLTNASQLWMLDGKPFMYDLSDINDVLKIVKVPASLRQINEAFKNCTALTNVIGFEGTNLGDGVVNVPAGSPASNHILTTSFNGCRSLTRLDIPNCDVIGTPFVGCAALDTLTFKALYNKTIGQTLVANGGSNVFGIYDPDNANYNAAAQSALKVIEFNGILNGTVNDDAFVGLKGLVKVDFKGKLRSDTHIKGAFTDVTTLTDVIFNGIESDGVANVTIENNAFKNTGIAAIDFKGITLKSNNNKNFEIWANAFSDCANLADIKTGDIKIQNTGTFSIAGTAFTNNPLLAKVTFGATAFTGAGTITIANDAFATGNVALAAVEWGNITSTTATPAAGFNSTITIGAGARVFGDTKALATVKFGTIDAGTLTIAAEAFRSSGLSSVQFGNITTPLNLNSAVTIGQNAFASAFIVGVPEPEAKTVKFGTISENRTGTTANQMTFHIFDGAFTAESLKEVEFDAITAYDVDIDGRVVPAPGIDKGAFESQNLQKVKFGNIIASRYSASTFDIADNAFLGGNVAAKKVEIGNIANNTSNLTATIGANAFQADSLQSVKIGDMTANSLTIAAQAFEGKALTTVSLGKMTAATLNINGNNAFANANNVDALIENITIGEIGAGLNITGANVFQGPQVAGSELNVTIAKLGGAATIPANTFVAPGKGTASYTITGDVVAASTANIAAGAFVGSKENIPTPVENTTSVWVKGDYNEDFVADAFLNVNDVTLAVSVDENDPNNYINVKKYNVNGSLEAFQGAKYVVVGDMPATKTIQANGAGTGNIEWVIFAGSVGSANAIGIFNSPKIRKIAFANVETTGVKVAAGAVAPTAFQAAGTDAGFNGEKISVIYKEEQTREAEIIFDQTAFAAAAGDEVATLYTTSWAKANVYEAADVLDVPVNPGDPKQCVYRLGYSESDVIPGMPIIAETVKKEGNTYGYAKLYIPKGINMKYKVPALYDAASDKNGIQLYYGRIDNSNNKIYMYNLPVIDDYYWIDATKVDQAFVVRTNSDIYPLEAVLAETVTAEEDALFSLGDVDHYYFGAALAVQNQLRYNTAEIANQELRNNAEFEGRDVYVMANPASYTNLTFAKFNKDATYTKQVGDHEIGDLRWLSAKSLYIVGKKNAAGAPELEVVFEGDENFDAETTGIETVKAAESNDAIFNLQGVRVNNAQKGIYIMNGKKVVLK